MMENSSLGMRIWEMIPLAPGSASVQFDTPLANHSQDVTPMTRK